MAEALMLPENATEKKIKAHAKKHEIDLDNVLDVDPNASHPTGGK
jgi:hypothetical protein